ncbi:DEK domain-containing chromatin-associated protein 2-like [Lolium rigidum]|uniref:DEK domain-containing chromatin-associated protein 2-like n=1 Tax=Lolium rigidum TaxID=89674 RepID=UPI001F5DC70B|nr:DEK domain-containing chromatin-associated protein 2-like [Lolium rigidum]
MADGCGGEGGGDGDGSAEWLPIFHRVEATVSKTQAQTEVLAADCARLEAADRVQRESWELVRRLQRSVDELHAAAREKDAEMDRLRAEAADASKKLQANATRRMRWEAAYVELLLGANQKLAELRDTELEDSRTCAETPNSKEVGRCAKLNQDAVDHTASDLSAELRKLKQAYETLSSKKDKEVSALLSENDSLRSQLDIMQQDHAELLKNKKNSDRPHHERKIVERLVEVIDKEPNRNFVVEKGRGTPLKDIPSVAQRLSKKKSTDLKFLHNVLFGSKGKTVDFKGHILQFSGFVWHESDEKQRAKAKKKLDRCMKDMLVELCSVLAIPVPKTDIRKEDIVAKLLDFIAEPHAMSDSGLSDDDQGSNSWKRKRGGDSSSKTLDATSKRSKKKFGDDVSRSKRRKQALEYDSDEDMENEDQPMKSDSEEDADEAPDEQEDGYESAEEKASKKSSDIKDSSGKKKAAVGSIHTSGPPRTTSKSACKTSPSKVSKEKESPYGSAKVFSRKKKPTISNCTPSSEKEIEEKKLSGKEATKGKGEAAEGGLPSEAELKKTIIGILRKVDFETSTFSDILRKLDDHYKIDLEPRKGAIKIMIQQEVTKYSRWPWGFVTPNVHKNTLV